LVGGGAPAFGEVSAVGFLLRNSSQLNAFQHRRTASFRGARQREPGISRFRIAVLRTASGMGSGLKPRRRAPCAP
jgi:hypothetical protein